MLQVATKVFSVCALALSLGWTSPVRSAPPTDIKAFLVGESVTSSGSRFALPPDHGGEHFDPDGTWRMSGGRAGVYTSRYTVKGDHLCVEYAPKKSFCRQVKIENNDRLFYRDLPDGAWREATIGN